MSQISVRKGFAARPYVRNESFSAHEMIYARLASPDTLQALSSWMDEAMQRRRELDRSKVSPSQYKAPSRVTLNEAKLANYVKDLADPNVPLTRLSRSVPHGFRGEKLFEMLWAGGALPAVANTTGASHFNPRSVGPPAQSAASTPSAAPAPRKSVDISRAVWFIRALGAAELSSLRNKSAATIVPEISSNLCTWMAKQVAELSLVPAAESFSTAAASPAPASPSTHLPRTPTAGPSSLSRSVATAHLARTPSNLNPASSPSFTAAKELCITLQNEVDEERWTAKWSYSLSLARHLHAQHLLDRSILVRWIVDAFAASNLVQLPFLLELVQEVLVFILRRRCFVRPFLNALLLQIPTLDARFDRTAAGGLRGKLMLLFRIVCETIPDALVSPRLWSEHAVTLSRLLHEMNTEAGADPTAAAPLHVAEYVEQTVKPRIDRLLLQTQSCAEDNDPKSSANLPLSHTLQLQRDIQALDSFDMRTLDHVFLQSATASNRPARHQREDAFWAPRIENILTWACTDRRSGVARQYLAATLIEKIRFGVAWEETSEEGDQISLPAFDLDHHVKKTRRINVEPMLIKWLGDVEASLNQGVDNVGTDSRASLLASVEVASVVVLVGELARRGVFSYTKYLQRLIARGMTATSSSREKEHGANVPASATATQPGSSSSHDSLHLRLLRSLPLYDQPASVYQQRKQAIYGDRTKETYEDAAHRRALRQLQSSLPFVFAEDAEGGLDGQIVSHVAVTQPARDLREPGQALSRLWSASRFVRCKIFRNDLLTAVTARIDNLNGEQLSQVSAVLVMGDDFESLAQLLATLLLRPLSDSLARTAFNMVIEFSLVWRSMDIMGTFNQLVRQQLNHSSSIRNDRQAVMASTTLLRLRTLIEGIPSRVDAPPLDMVSEHDAIQQHVQALRPNVDILLDNFAQRMPSSADVKENSATTPTESYDILTPFRNLFLQPDATSDEIIERTIVESVFERSQVAVIPAAVRLIDQLYLEASLEIDERHARWLVHLANSMEQGTYAVSSVKALLGLLTRLVAHGTLNLQLAVDTYLLPYLSSSVRRMTDPATRGSEMTFHLTSIVSCLREMFASSLGEVSTAPSFEDRRSFGAQTVLLFAQANLPSLLRMVTCLICASDGSSPVTMAEKAQIETFWKSLLSSQKMQVAFRQSPRLCMLTIRDTCKSMWGCNPSRAMDQAMACLDPTSLLLRDVTSVDAASVKARLDGWDTAVVANELVEIFERLHLVESSFQSRADSKTKALASGLFDDLFVRLPDIGAQLMRDCQSSGLTSRFTDIGLKTLLDKVKAWAEAELELANQSAATREEGTGGNEVDTAGAGASQETGPKGDSQTASTLMEISSNTDVESTVQSVLRMCEQQDSFVFNATDAESCGQILLHVITTLEAAAIATGSSPEDIETRLAALLHHGPTFDLLHLVVRFGCLWNSQMKGGALRLIKALLALTRRAGETAECGRLFVLLLDSLSFVLDELPPQLLGVCIADLETQLHQADLATPERNEKLQQLSFTLDATSAQGWFVASSAGAALKRGWFTPGGLNPWECAEYLDAPSGAAAPGAGAGAGTAAVGGHATRGVQMQGRTMSPAPPAAGVAQGQSAPPSDSEVATLPGARLGWPTKLSLNTAIPLSMLGLRVTRDLVPHYASPASPSAASVGSNNDATSTASTAPPGLSTLGTTPIAATAGAVAEKMDEGASPSTSTLPIFVESERTYGERLAGEPAFSRDLRRGLLVQPRLPCSSSVGGTNEEEASVGLSAEGRISEAKDAQTSVVVGLSSDAIPVIDLTWDEDEVMPPQPPPPQQQQSNVVERTAQGSRKRRMSKRD